jgi:hypothetical protein
MPPAHKPQKKIPHQYDVIVDKMAKLRQEMEALERKSL